MAFKMVTDSEKVAGKIAGMAKVHAEEMTGELVERWRGWLAADAEDVGIGQIQLFYAAKLRRLCRALARAERAHIRQLTAIKLLRQQRDKAADELRLKAHHLEMVLQGRHGEAFAEDVLEKAAELTDPVALRRVATRVAKNLVDPKRPLPEPRVSGTDFDFSDFAWQIAEPAGRLSTHLDDLENQLPLLSATLERKIWALAAVKDLTKRLARFLHALYGLEGQHDELQAKVKQALKRARKAVAAAERREAAEAEGGEVPAADVTTGEAPATVAADGRLRKAKERLAPREEPMSAFDEGEREALAEAADYYARRQAETSGDGTAQAETSQAEPDGADGADAATGADTAGGDAGAGPPRQESPGTEEAAAAGPVEVSEADPEVGSRERSTDASGEAGGSPAAAEPPPAPLPHRDDA